MPEKLRIDDVERIIHQIRTRLRNAPRSPLSLSDDHCDLLHDVLVTVLRRLPEYDFRRGPLRRFIARITDSVLIDHVRRQSAVKRNPIRHQDQIRNDRLKKLADLESDRRPSIEDLAIDLAEAIEKLPPGLAELAVALQEWSPSEIAQRTGVHRGTIHRRMKQIQDRWQDTSLRDYIDS